jgi:exosortase/archaeosortase family protein
MALLSVTTLVGYVWEPTAWRRVAVAALAVPLAVALNSLRIGLTGFAALRFGPWVAHGAVHEAAGAVVFVVAIACVTALHWRKRETPRLTTTRLEAA